MLYRSSICAIAFMLGLVLTFADARAFDETKYPDWAGQWKRPRGLATQWDQTKPSGLGQQAPLKPEYLKNLQDSRAHQAHAGQAAARRYTPLLTGLPPP